MQADELEGLHAEPELSLVDGGIGLDSRVHNAPSQSKKTQNIRNSTTNLYKHFVATRVSTHAYPFSMMV